MAEERKPEAKYYVNIAVIPTIIIFTSVATLKAQT